MTFGALLLGVHLLGAIAWVGGMFFVLVVLRPSLAILDAGQRLALLVQVFRRFFLVVCHVMPLMLITGLAMEYLFYGGVSTTPWPLQVMMGTGIVMAVIFVVIVAWPWAALRRALGQEDLPRAGAAVQRIRLLVSVNFVLGVLTAIVAVLDV